MPELGYDIDISNVDPKAPLSSSDLLKLILNQCSTISQEWIKHERDFTDDKLKTVINGFADKINNLIDNVNRENSGLVDKIRDLETKLDATNNFIEKKLAEADSGLDNLRNSLFSTFNLIQTDMKYLYSETLMCHVCAQRFMTHKDLQQHIQSLHARAPPHPCAKCSQTFKSIEEFTGHICQNHGQKQDEASQTFNSRMHDFPPNYQAINNLNDNLVIECGSVSSNHEPLTRYSSDEGILSSVSWEVCNQSFISSNNLNLHNQRNHGLTTSFVCEICGLVFSTECLLDAHTENSHQDLRSCVVIHCSYCSQTFNSMVELNCHVQDTHAAPGL